VLARDDAEQESKQANAQTALANDLLRDSLEAQAKERAQTELAERHLYEVRMKLVQRYWDGRDGDLLQVLVDQVPAEGSTDRRGYEWFYRRQKLSGYLTLRGHVGAIRTVAFSPDGKLGARFAGNRK
jgi:hypothetical protein